jgi:hypothetical protein
VSLILLAALACGHEDPIAPGSGGADGPWNPAAPVRLTWASGYESTPSWLPDGSGILHSFDRILGGRFDRCLGLLPPGGGSRTLEFCEVGPGAADSLDAIGSAGASPGGRLIYLWSQTVGVQTAPSTSRLVLASVARPYEATTLTPVPYSLPGSRVHSNVARVDWLDDDRAVYLGEWLVYPVPCMFCEPDTMRVGREGVLVNLAGAAPSLSIIPGTEDATSLAASPGGSHVYFTLPLDTRVLRLPPTGGVPEVVHDFAAFGIVRDVAVSGDRLVAVVGGTVTPMTDPFLGSWLEDGGGQLVHLDLTSGQVTPIAPVNSFTVVRWPVLSPPGTTPRIAAETYAPAPDDLGGPIIPIPDLWLYEAP